MSLYGIKDSANLTLFSKKTGKPVLYSDYCNQTSLNMTADTVYAMKKTARAISWDTSKEGTLTMEMQVFDLKWIALLMGSLEELSAAPTSIAWAKREILTAASAGAAMTIEGGTPEADSLTVYKLGKDGISLGDEVAATGYDLSGDSLTVTGSAKDEKFCVFYLTNLANSRKFTVSGDKYPTGYRVVFDTMIRDTDQQDHFVQFDFYNLRPKAQMELTMSAEDVCTLSVEWDVLVDNENRFFDFIYLDDEAAGDDDNTNTNTETPTPTPSDPTYTDEDFEVVDEPTGNPSTQGWYVKDPESGEYSLTDDETVDNEKTYYTLKTSG